jgi:hypothetical protein
MFYTSTEYNALVIICHHIGIVKEKVLCRYNMDLLGKPCVILHVIYQNTIDG